MNTFDKIMMALLAITIVTAMILLNSCQLPSVTVHGQYADYTVTPHKPIEIEPAK